MGLGTFYTVGSSMMEVRRYWHGHHCLRCWEPPA